MDIGKMNRAPEITDMLVYVPSKDHRLSAEFYRELGFDVREAWGGNLDCYLGKAQFRLQNYYQKDWAENTMLQFAVPDVRAWYAHAKPIVDSGRYPETRVSNPSRHDGATIVHIHDPAGVLLIFIQHD